MPIFIFILTGTFNVNKRNAIIYTAITLLILITFYRVYNYSHLIDRGLLAKQVAARLDGLMYGVVCAYISKYYKGIWMKYKNVLFVTGIMLLVSSRVMEIWYIKGWQLYYTVFSFSLNSLATSLAMPFLSNLKEGKGFVFRSVTKISLISYSLYLLNFSVMQDWILNHFLKLNFDSWNLRVWHKVELIKYILYWVLTFLFVTLLYKYLELPIMNLRRKIKIK